MNQKFAALTANELATVCEYRSPAIRWADPQEGFGRGFTGIPSLRMGRCLFEYSTRLGTFECIHKLLT